MKVLPWSHSAMNDFETCAKAYFHKRIAKDVVETQGDAAAWGDEAHKFIEYELKRQNGTTLAPEQLDAIAKGKLMYFNTYMPWIDTLFAMEPDQLLPEQQLAINKELQPCDWMDKRVWCRGIIDVLLIKGDRARAIDWKTGKRKPNSRQLKLFALLIFIHYPQVMKVKTDFIWLATNEIDSEHFTRNQEAELWQEFLPSLAAYNKAFKEETFPPKKSGLCAGWCPVTSCENWRPKRR